MRRVAPLFNNCLTHFQHIWQNKRENERTEVRWWSVLFSWAERPAGSSPLALCTQSYLSGPQSGRPRLRPARPRAQPTSYTLHFYSLLREHTALNVVHAAAGGGLPLAHGGQVEHCRHARRHRRYRLAHHHTSRSRPACRGARVREALRSPSKVPTSASHCPSRVRKERLDTCCRTMHTLSCWRPRRGGSERWSSKWARRKILFSVNNN